MLCGVAIGLSVARGTLPAKDHLVEFELPKTLASPPTIGEAERSRMVDMAELIDAADGSSIVIPSAGAWLKTSIIVAKPLRITGGGHKLLVSDSAKIHVAATASLAIDHAEIHIESDSITPNNLSLIQLDGSALSLTNNIIYNILPSQASSHHEFDENNMIDTSYWLVFAEDNKVPKELYIKKNQIFSYFPYSAGGVHAKGEVTGVISDNNFEYLHAALRFPNAKDLSISRNRILMASYGAINLGGTFGIKDNKILYPGGGIAGDGITIVWAKNAIVDDNLIFGGTCYGIWVKSDRIDGLNITNNTISSGITSGLHISAVMPAGYVIQNVVIRDNVFADNAGFGVSIAEGKNIVVENNLFHHNAPNYTGEIYTAADVSAKILNNMQSIPTDFTWSRQIEYYRTHVDVVPSMKQLVHTAD